MTSHKSRYKNALEIVVVAILLLAGYAILQKLTGISAVLLESNLQSNLARISRYLHAPKIDTVLVGSSMSGRLLSSYFQESGMEVANLGLDGCYATIGLEIVQLRTKLPKLVLVELAAIPINPNAFENSNETALRDAFQSPTFKIGAVVPSFRPENRPLSILYWWIKKLSGSNSGRVSHSAGVIKDDYTQSEVSRESFQTDTIDELQIKQIERPLVVLKERGVDVRILAVPHTEGWGIPQSGLIRRISQDLNMPILEPGVELSKKIAVLRFTDGAHLDAASAKQIVAETVKELRENVVQP